MRSKGKALIDKIETSLSFIQTLIETSFNEEDYSKIVTSLGGEVEKFIKSTVLNVNSGNFYNLIEELINHGITQTSIDKLHEFRQCYNGYKHDPSYTKTILEVTVIQKNLKLSIDEILSKNLGDVGQTYNNKSKRVVWFAAWDDYIGGMTECSIFIPDYKIDMPRGIDHFNLDFKAWDTIIKDYANNGELKLGKEYVSNKAYEFWKAQSDFLDAGAFYGDVAEFIRKLSKNIAKNENELIPFLKRDHDSWSVYSSIVFSLFDTLRNNSYNSESELKDEILLRMNYDYGIDLNSPYLNYVDYLNFRELVNDKNQLKNINDILWLDDIKYNTMLKKEYSGDLFIGIDDEKNLITKVKDYG